MEITNVSIGVIVLVLIIIVMAILTVALFIMIRRPGIDNPGADFYLKSMKTLNERLAAGEISLEEYDQLKRKIQGKE